MDHCPICDRPARLDDRHTLIDPEAAVLCCVLCVVDAVIAAERAGHLVALVVNQPVIAEATR